MRLILLGPPGSGKGTQAERLCERLGLEHIGTGDLLRAAARQHTPVGVQAEPYLLAGDLVPDALINGVIAERFRQPDRPTRYVMDGYPRTVAQARAFDDLLREVGLDLSAVVLLAVPDEEIIRRAANRWSCPRPGCKATYNALSNPPQVPGICDKCGTALVQRPDDHADTVRTRLGVYHQRTQELIPYYRPRGLLREVQGHGGIEEIYNSIVATLPS